MLDLFLKAACQYDQKRADAVKLAHDLKKLPDIELLKIARGESKVAFGSSADWLDKYQDTELFAEALALEKAELENDIARQQDEASRPPTNQQFWQTGDQIRLQKKMLDLKLIEMQGAAGLPVQPGGQLPTEVTPTSQGAGALGDAAEGGASNGDIGGMGDVAKAASVKEALSLKTVGEYAEKRMARGMSQDSIDKMKNTAGNLASIGGRIAGNQTVTAKNPGMKLIQQGAVLANKLKKVSSVEDRFEKAAFDLSGMGKGLMAAAKANPGAAIGTAVGAAGGLANGLKKDQQGNRHIVSGLAQGVAGGVAGGAVGHAAGKFHGNYQLANAMNAQAGAGAVSKAQLLKGTAQATGHGLMDDARALKNRVTGAFNKAPAQAVPAAAPPPQAATDLKALAAQQGAANNIKQQMGNTFVPEEGLFGPTPKTYGKYAAARLDRAIRDLG